MISRMRRADLAGEEEGFLAKVVGGGRVTVPYEVREKLGIEPGDLVKITIKKEEVIEG